jgi:gamma-glutamyltranspeptidase/glutathione hydrolase
MLRTLFALGLPLVVVALVFSPGYFEAATLKPQVMGKRGVVAAGHPLVAEAGLRILEKGGNAVDAGVATVFAAAVVEQSSFGLGGEAPILIKLAGKPVVVINGDGIAPELATAEFFEKLPADDPSRGSFPATISGKSGIIPSYGPLSAIVPGAVDALLLALKDYGTLNFAEVVQPAIELAQGFPADARLAGNLAQDEKIYSRWPSSLKVYEPKGHTPQEGELWSQPDLARTLESMAEVEKKNAAKGRAAALDAVRDYFYRGPIARRISEFCKQAGCLLREGDFAAYHAKAEAPLSTTYRGVEVYKPGFWTQGPALLENLNLIEAYDLKTMGHNSADYIHMVVEAMKLGYADRDAYYGDPDFSKVPAELITKEYATMRRPLLNRTKASPDHLPGDPERMQAVASEDFIRARYRRRNGEHQDTTCVNVIDKAGNMFSATPSGAWIPAVIAGDTGIPLTERGQSFVLTPGHPNQIAPHKRPRITLTPTIALRDGKPWLAFSTPGGDSQDQTLLQVFLNMVEFGMGPQQAVEAPRFNSLAPYSSFDDHADDPLGLQVEKRIPEKALTQLRELGHKLIVLADWGIPTSPTVVEYDAATGVIKGGADVRRHRYALAW